MTPSREKSFISRIWSGLVNWFETGDLVPLLVIVSAVHYAYVLATKDFWPVAIAIGILVDLGHYRTVRTAVRYKGYFWQAVFRWTIAAGMTALSLNYHQRYYMDWWLSAPLPLLIAALAWLKQTEPKVQSKVEHDTPHMPSIVVHDAEPVKALPASYACKHIGCTVSRESPQKLAAHVRWDHRKVDQPIE
jgi:hypothetical protein